MRLDYIRLYYLQLHPAAVELSCQDFFQGTHSMGIESAQYIQVFVQVLTSDQV